jgi:hypothetical protein
MPTSFIPIFAITRQRTPGSSHLRTLTSADRQIIPGNAALQPFAFRAVLYCQKRLDANYERGDGRRFRLGPSKPVGEHVERS